MEEYILEKYNNYKSKKIQSGYRCNTFLLDNEKNKYIYQVYIGYTKYQARKKEYITNLIKKCIDIEEIPNIIEFDEKENFSYLVSQYKEGKEMETIIKEGKFNYKNFYKTLSDILIKIHSVEVGEKFRMDWKQWNRRKKILSSIY